MEDKRDLLDRARSSSEAYSGVPISDEEIAHGFYLHSAASRMSILDQLAAEDSNNSEIPFNEVDMRKAASRADLIGQLKDTHRRLTKIGR